MFPTGNKEKFLACSLQGAWGMFPTGNKDVPYGEQEHVPYREHTKERKDTISNKVRKKGLRPSLFGGSK